MGCDIHLIAQKAGEDGRWQTVSGEFTEGTKPFDWRSYGMFAFLANVRNYSDITPISDPRGFPEDFEDESEWGEFSDLHSCSWLSVEEMLAVDYEQIIENRRVTRQLAPNIFSGSQTCSPGEGKSETLREFLGKSFFNDLEKLKELSADRIVFGFDS